MKVFYAELANDWNGMAVAQIKAPNIASAKELAFEIYGVKKRVYKELPPMARIAA